MAPPGPFPDLTLRLSVTFPIISSSISPIIFPVNFPPFLPHTTLFNDTSPTFP